MRLAAVCRPVESRRLSGHPARQDRGGSEFEGGETFDPKLASEWEKWPEKILREKRGPAQNRRGYSVRLKKSEKGERERTRMTEREKRHYALYGDSHLFQRKSSSLNSRRCSLIGAGPAPTLRPSVSSVQLFFYSVGRVARKQRARLCTELIPFHSRAALLLRARTFFFFRLTLGKKDARRRVVFSWKSWILSALAPPVAEKIPLFFYRGNLIEFNECEIRLIGWHRQEERGGRFLIPHLPSNIWAVMNGCLAALCQKISNRAFECWFSSLDALYSPFVVPRCRFRPFEAPQTDV